MVNKFRENHPKRTCTKTYAKYSNYKLYLAEDFYHKCGYTDCSDFWFGGTNSFHIDHFIPWKNYPDRPELKTNYQNLVYCCSYVNILKSNDETAYIDPCNVDFNEHFARDISGNIIPVDQSASAKYMYKKLKLYLRRYQIVWMLDKIHSKMGRLKMAIENPKNTVIKDDLLKLNGELAMLMTEYIDYLKANQ